MSHFNGVYRNSKLDKTSLSQEMLDISKKYKSNPLPWSGQFSPQLVQVLLCEYAKKSDILFDPFLGSGTSLLESGEYGIRASGTEINYAAICLSRIYQLINMPFPERIILLNTIENALIHTGLIYKNDLFTERKDINPIVELERVMDSLSEAEGKIILEAFIILIDMYKGNFSQKWLEQKWHKIKDLIKSLPVSSKNIEVYHEDARRTTLKTSSSSFVITSPPYINVFNYHQQYRASAEYLNGSVLLAAQAEIGSNRKYRGNRFLTVIQYCLDMAMVFQEINRICKKDSRVIFVVGRESSVRKTPFYNGEIVSELACRACGMTLEMRQERLFTNKFGLSIFEDILHFSSTKEAILSVEDASREIALQVLKSVAKTAPDESKEDLAEAINRIQEIESSPILENALVRG